MNGSVVMSAVQAKSCALPAAKQPPRGHTHVIIRSLIKGTSPPYAACWPRNWVTSASACSGVAARSSACPSRATSPPCASSRMSVGMLQQVGVRVHSCSMVCVQSVAPHAASTHGAAAGRHAPRHFQAGLAEGVAGALPGRSSAHLRVRRLPQLPRHARCTRMRTCICARTSTSSRLPFPKNSLGTPAMRWQSGHQGPVNRT